MRQRGKEGRDPALQLHNATLLSFSFFSPPFRRPLLLFSDFIVHSLLPSLPPPSLSPQPRQALLFVFLTKRERQCNCFFISIATNKDNGRGSCVDVCLLGGVFFWLKWTLSERHTPMLALIPFCALSFPFFSPRIRASLLITLFVPLVV